MVVGISKAPCPSLNHKTFQRERQVVRRIQKEETKKVITAGARNWKKGAPFLSKVLRQWWSMFSALASGWNPESDSRS